ERLIEAVDGADLFLCEATSYAMPIPNHLTYKTVAANRDRFNAARVVLTHVGADVLARARTLTIDLARDGQVFVLARKPKPASLPQSRTSRRPRPAGAAARGRATSRRPRRAAGRRSRG